MLNEEMPANEEQKTEVENKENDQNNLNNEILMNIAQQLQANTEKLTKIEKARNEVRYPDEDTDDDEDKALERKMNAMLEERLRRESQKRIEERNNNPVPFLRNELADFDKIYTKENIEKIPEKYPAINYAIQQKLQAGQKEEAVRLAYSVMLDEKKRAEQVAQTQNSTPQARSYNRNLNPRLAGTVATGAGGRTTSTPNDNYADDYISPFKFAENVSVILNGNAFRSKNGIPFCKSERCKKAHIYLNSIKE